MKRRLLSVLALLWLTLDGRKVNKPTQRGIYINRGKKVVIK